MKKSTKLLPTDIAALPDVTVTDDDMTARLSGNGLNVKRVTTNPAGGIVVHWRKPPTEAEQAFAQELIGQPVQHA